MTEIQFKNLWKNISHKYKNKVKFEKIDLNNGFLNLNLYAEFDVDFNALEKDLNSISSNEEVKFYIKKTEFDNVFEKKIIMANAPLLLISNLPKYFSKKEVSELIQLIDIDVIWLYNVPNSKKEISIEILDKLHLMGLNRLFEWLLIVDDQNSNFF